MGQDWFHVHDLSSSQKERAKKAVMHVLLQRASMAESRRGGFKAMGIATAHL
jgi:hypothetical protein